MNQNKQASSKNFQFPYKAEPSGFRPISNFQFKILIIVIIILLTVAIIVSFPKKEESMPDQLIIPGNTEVEVIKSSENMPDVPGLENNKTDTNSPQGGPATIEDLGGGVNQPTNLEELLENKEIDF